MKNTFNTITPEVDSNDFCFEIHVTEMCNYSCSYCNLSPMNKHNMVDYDKMFSLNLPENTRVFLMGGEPTIDKFFFDIVNKCYEKGFTNIDVQTNLTFNVERMVKKLTANKTPVKFYGSFHMEYSDIRKFIKKCVFLKKNNMYGGVHLMWLKKLNEKCISYYKLLDKTLDNISLEPTLPKSLFSIDWEEKQELKSFLDYGHINKCIRLKNIIDIDGNKMSIGDALQKNIERSIYGKKCNAPSKTVIFSVNKNKFFNCTFDLLFNRKFNEEEFNKGVCICKNNICCADLEFKKY
jgi:organic radical activating enzyme